LAILNSDSRAVLWAVILFSMLATRKYRLLRRLEFWAMCILIIAASFWRGASLSITDRGLRFADLGIRFFTSLNQFGSALGLAIGAVMVIGIIVKLRRPGDHRGRWAAAGGLLLAALLWTTTAPGELDGRRLLLALPVALMFAAAGGAWLLERNASRPYWVRSGRRFRVSVWAILGVLALMSATGSWTREHCTGFAPLAETLIEDSAPEDVTLVSSDPSGEERFIAELAMREQRPGHTLLCGTRFLANPGKKFIANEPAFPSDQAVFDFLTSGKIKYIVIDDAIPDEERREHHYQLRRAIEEHLNRFWVIANCPVTRDGVTQPTPAKLYKIKGIN